MPDEQQVKNILNGFISAYEFADECYWQAFDIDNFDEQELIETDVSGYIASRLLHGNFIDNVNVFDQKMHLNLLIMVSSEDCETPEEVISLKKCCDDLRILAQNNLC